MFWLCIRIIGPTPLAIVYPTNEKRKGIRDDGTLYRDSRSGVTGSADPICRLGIPHKSRSAPGIYPAVRFGMPTYFPPGESGCTDRHHLSVGKYPSRLGPIISFPLRIDRNGRPHPHRPLYRAADSGYRGPFKTKVETSLPLHPTCGRHSRDADGFLTVGGQPAKTTNQQLFL